MYMKYLLKTKLQNSEANRLTQHSLIQAGNTGMLPSSTRSIIAKVLNCKLLDEKNPQNPEDKNGLERTGTDKSDMSRRYGWSYGGQAGRDGGEKIGEEKFFSSPGIFRFYLQ